MASRNESKLSEEDKLKFNSMTFHEFDQEPDGVRKLANSGNYKAAGEATESYIAANEEKLTPAQRCLLWFHAGQNAALANKHDEAIEFFHKASETVPDEKKYALAEFVGPATEFYLKATIAFIKNQKKFDRENIKALHEAFYEIKKIPIEAYPPTNVVLIPGRVYDMCSAAKGTTYKDIFDLPPSLPPLPEEKNQEHWHRINIPKNIPEKEKMNYEGMLVGEYRSKLEDALNQERLIQGEFGQASNTAKRLR